MSLTANYHTHTWRCRHAFGEDREYVEAAIAAGFRILGFSDHMPWWADTPGLDHSRMDFELMEDYFTSLNALKKEYADRIEIHIGFEAEYYEDLMPRQLEELRRYSCEYLILGQHFGGYGKRAHYFGRPFSEPEMLETYVRQITDGIRSGLFLYVAHPDLPFFQGEEPVLRSAYEQILLAAEEKDLPLEINLLGALQNRNYPSELFFRMAKENGNRCIVGLDAHKPEQFQFGPQLERAMAIAGGIQTEPSLTLKPF
ncbi:MAG: histidinol-phosphatase [Oscillospiraceae bacterium]|nr:histidinol-phosphatase [Oscillospiraceae bacterium]